MQPDSSVRISSAESPPRSLDSPDSCIVEADVSEVANESGLFAGETICIEMESTKITFCSSLVCEGYFEVLSVQSEKQAPVIETGDVLREFQGIDMRVSPQRLRQLFSERVCASVVLVFEKKKWGGTLLRLSFKVLTSPLRIEKVPEWTDDAPSARMVSEMAGELLANFKPPAYCVGTSALMDTSCFSDVEWRSTMLKFARILQDKPLDQARLALCEAMTVLLLHQNVAPLQKSALPILEVSTTLTICNIDPKSDMIGETTFDSPATPNMTKPKTLLELADGDIDMLDDSAMSNSAVENSNIEIEYFVDDDASKPMSETSFALKESPEIQGMQYVPEHSGPFLRIGEMQIPMRLRQNSFLSPVHTPRNLSLTKSLQSTPSLQPRMSPISILSSSNELIALSLQQKEQKSSVDSVDKDIAKAELGYVGHINRSTKSLPQPESTTRSVDMDGNYFLGPAMTPTKISARVPFKPETALLASKKSSPAARAAETAARMAQELKTSIVTQAQHARFQAVQAAASQQIVAGMEHGRPQKALESAYMNKVEEASILRKEYENSQENIGASNLNLSSSIRQSPAENEMPSQDDVLPSFQKEIIELDDGIQYLQSACGAVAKTDPPQLQLHLPSLTLENVPESASQEITFEA